MNMTDTQARTWSPQVVMLTVLLHIGVLYAVAVAFNVVPPPIESVDEAPLVMATYTPPPPPPPQTDPVELKRPEYQQRIPTPAPVPVTVQPSPLPPIAVPQTEGTPSIDVAQPIPEQPTVRTAIHYPAFAEQQQIEGKVTLSITIMPDGSVRDVRVVNAAPRGVFEDSAIQSVARWRYKPSGVIRTNVIVQIDFVLS